MFWKLFGFNIYSGYKFRRISEMETIMVRAEDSTKAQIEDATAKLHEKISEASAYKLENDRLKVCN